MHASQVLTIRRRLGLVVLLVSAAISCWGWWPSGTITRSLSIPGSHSLSLTWPETSRAGDSQAIRMNLRIGPEGVQVESGRSGESLVSANAEAIETDPTGNFLAEARLELGGIRVAPAETVIQPLQPGKSVTFFWETRPARAGIYNGVAWLYFRSVSSGEGPDARTPISAQEIQIRTVELAGLGGSSARFLGGIGLLAGAVLGLDDLFLRAIRRLAKDHGQK